MKLNTRSLILYSLLGTILFASQVVLNFLPNVELVSFLVIIYSLIYGKNAQVPILIFNMLMGLVYGFGPWLIGYFILWPLLSLMTIILRKFLLEKYLALAIFSAIYGLIFGFLYAIPYFFVSPSYAITYWISGIPYDIVHMISNYFIMLTLGKIFYNLIKNLNKQYRFN